MLGKILEKIIQTQIYEFFSSNNLFHYAQSGFHKGHSTVTCATLVCNDILLGFDEGLLTGALFLDLKKDFDTADHSILCDKLAKYGLVNSAVKWISSYLSGRMQCTAFASATSSVKSINCGVPQGSTLGPLLFIIYLNDLPQVLINSCISLYADDTAIYYQSNNANETEVMLQEDLVLIQNWMKVNKLSLNVSKTKSMLFIYSRTSDSVLLTQLRFLITLPQKNCFQSTSKKLLPEYL